MNDRTLERLEEDIKKLYKELNINNYPAYYGDPEEYTKRIQKRFKSYNQNTTVLSSSTTIDKSYLKTMLNA